MVLAFVLCYSVVYFASILSSTEAIECQGTARYTLTFRAEWTSQSHSDFPSGAHFSSLVGCSHKADYVMWTPGIKATTGVKNVAEFGATSVLNSEMDNQINLKNVHKRYRGSAIFSTGTSSISNIEVNSDYPLASFITMIAPSPDWFVGVHDFNLCNTTTGKWEDSRTRDLPPYDAGTDSGTRFASRNEQTNPPENIHLLTNNTEGSFKGNKLVRRFGTFTFVKTYDSNPVIKPSSTMKQSQPSGSANAQSSTITIDPKERSTQQVDMNSTPSTKPNVPSQTLNPTATITASAIIKPSSTMKQSQPSTSVNAESSTIMNDPKESSTQQVDMKISPSTNPNVRTQTLIPTATITTSAITTLPSTMKQSQPSTSVNPNVRTQTLIPTATITTSAIITLPSTMKQRQPSTSVNATSLAIMIDPKESSTQRVDMQSSPTAKPNVSTQTPSPTTRITASASVEMTPTFTTTSSACSLKQLGFIHVVFAMILVNFCL